MTTGGEAPPTAVRPCRRCGRPTGAMRDGRLLESVMCPRCTMEDEKEFRLAQLAANRQSRSRAGRK